jgi:hypothetical protein
MCGAVWCVTCSSPQLLTARQCRVVLATVHGACAPPCVNNREDTAWAYDARSSSFLMFGGWASRWLGDLVRLDVSAIIGPPYACTGDAAAGGGGACAVL